MMQSYTKEDMREAFAFSFLKPEICHGLYFRIITNMGAEIVPADVIGRTCGTAAEAFAMYVEGAIGDPDECIECREGWFARMSASGYMDRTDWHEYPSEAAARRDLIETYGE
jgi:hypothetical protein